MQITHAHNTHEEANTAHNRSYFYPFFMVFACQFACVCTCMRACECERWCLCLLYVRVSASVSVHAKLGVINTEQPTQKYFQYM